MPTPTPPKQAPPHQHHLPVTLATPPVSVPPPPPMSLITTPSPMSLINTPTLLSNTPITVSHNHHATPICMPSSPQATPTSSGPGGPGPIRRRVSDKCNLPISAGEYCYLHIIDLLEESNKIANDVRCKFHVSFRFLQSHINYA